MVELNKGHNLIIIIRNSLKGLSGHLNIDPKPYAKYENPSSSRSQDIVLIRFLWPSPKRGKSLPFKVQLKQKIHVRLFFVLMLHIKFKVPSSSGSIVLQPTTLLYW